MNRFAEMSVALDCYKSKVDRIVREYRADQGKNAKIYNTEMCEKLKEESLAKKKAEYIEEQRNIAVRVSGVLEDVQDCLKRWISAPIRADQLALLQAMVSTGVKLTPPEFEALQESIGNNYFAWRLMEKVAETSGIKGFRSRFNLEKYLNMLQRVKNEAEIFISGYCGGGADYSPEFLNTKEFPNAKTLSYAAGAAKVLSADSSLSVASVIWSGESCRERKSSCVAISPRGLNRIAESMNGDSLPGSGKTKLTSSEMETIDQMFAGCITNEQKKARAAQLVKDTPLLRDVLKITVKYREFLPAEEADAD